MQNENNNSVKYITVEIDGEQVEIVRSDDHLAIGQIITEAGDREDIALYTKKELEKRGRAMARKAWQARHAGTLEAVAAELEARHKARQRASASE